ncbi:MAG: MFS transporter [Steroidobacteraceae bacterium]
MASETGKPAGGSVPAESSTGVRTGLWTTFASVVGLTFGPSAIAVLGFGVFVRPLEAEFGWTRTQVSLASVIISWMIVLVSPLQGILIDRFGARPVVLCSIPAFAAGIAALYVLPNNLAVFYLMWVIIPVLAVGLWPLAYLKAVSTWFDRRLGLAIGIANAGIGIGSALVPLIAGALIATYGWRSGYLGLAVIALVVTWPVSWLFLREQHAVGDAGKPGATAAPALFGIAFREAARTRTFWLLGGAYFLLGVINTALITQQIPMLIDSGLTPQAAAVVQSIFGIAMMVGRLGTGYVIDRVFAPWVMIVVSLGAAIACALYGTGVTGGMVFVSACLIGLVVGAEFDVLAFMIKRYFGIVAYGKLYGVIFAVFQFGAGIGAAALPISRGQFGSYTPGLYAFGIVLVLAAVVFSRLGAYTFQPSPPAAR